MKKSLFAIAMLLSISTAFGQGNNRADTTILGVYNTGTRFTITRADFGLQTPTELIAEMVVAFDTVKVITSVSDTSRGGSKKKQSFVHTCNYLSGLRRTPDMFKDKIVLMELNKDCDVTQVCLLAQRSGAKAFMFIHNSNSNGNIKLPKKGVFMDSIRIPVFVVGKEKGADISALLPSVVGIKTKTPPPTNRAIANDSTLFNSFAEKQTFNTVEERNPDSFGKGVTTNKDQVVNDGLTNSLSKDKQGFTVSPNPATNQADVKYQFAQATDVTIRIETESGQVINSQILRGVTVGSITLPTVDYPTGTYFVTLQYGKEVQTKKLIVRH